MPKRYWAFNDMKFNYEGYNVPEIYKAAWQAIVDRAYFVSEKKYIHVKVGNVFAAVAWWTGTYEAENKYSLVGMDVYLKIVWRLVPRPGTNGENAPQVPYGSVNMTINGFVVTDYLAIWGKSPVLSPFFDLRDRVFYKRKTDVLKKKVRQDAEGVINDLNDFISFLPQIT